MRPQLSEVDVVFREKRASFGPLPTGFPGRSLGSDEQPWSFMRGLHVSK